MRNHFRVVPVVFALVVLVSNFARADAESAQKLLQEKGLKKSKPYFLLEKELELTKMLRNATALRKKVFDAQKKAEAAEQQLAGKKRLIVTYLQQRRELRVQLDRTRSFDAYTKIVSALNELADRIALMEQSDDLEKAAKAARAAVSQATGDYSEHLLKAEKRLNSIKERYADLAADPKVREAIAEVNKVEGTEHKLGPGRTFLGSGKRLESLLEQVLSETIDVRLGPGDLWYVQVMFNGEHAKEISIDTGSSAIALPFAMAKEMGIEPRSNDPAIFMQLADGRIIEGRKIIVDKVRVGRFTVEGVECVVFPPHCTKAEPLLGMSYLQHFNYKIDTKRSKLVMSRVNTGSDKVSVEQAKDEPKKDEPVVKDAPKDRAAIIDKVVAGLEADGDQKGVMLVVEGKLAMFQPARSGPANALQRRLGPPDKTTKVPSPKADAGKDVKWQVQKWGKLELLVDEDGMVRYFVYAK